jgi:hypothetical protein
LGSRSALDIEWATDDVGIWGNSDNSGYSDKSTIWQ